MNTIKNAPLALVTGASRGIGKAIAEALAEAGYHLILTCSHTLPDLQEVAACLEEKYGITCTAMAAEPAAIKKVFASLDHLDVLVNNAGISYIGLLTDMSVEEWQHVLNTNLSSCFYTSRLAVPLMLLKHSGRIINISSVWGKVAYSASKGGVNSFTKALAKELAPSNIQVNAISCGVIDTAMNHCFSPEEMNALREEIPADRLGQPEEVAKLVLQLIQAPTYLTGQILTLDGGWQ
jgi:3-oxoacyl-[acyl-carrier protein] reductase